MEKNKLWKWVLLAALVCVSLIVVTPPESGLGKVLARMGIHTGIALGLDLRGGASYILEIDQEALANTVREDNAALSAEEIESRIAEAKRNAPERALEVIRNRVDGLGISEPVIYTDRGSRIIVQLPGVDEKKRLAAEEDIRRLAFLEFRMVHEENDRLTEDLLNEGAAPEGYRIAELQEQRTTRKYYVRDTAVSEAALAALRPKLAEFHAPPGHEMMLEATSVGGRTVYRPAFVSRKRELTGSALERAGVDTTSLSTPVVTLEFDKPGAKKFARITSDYAPGGPRNPNQNKRRQLAIILDGTLYSAPSIKEAIHGGRAQIEGRFTLDEAHRLANVLNSGSLPAPVSIAERRLVDPSLGVDSIQSGVRSATIGCLAVLVFMALYYRVAGLLANVALVLNMVVLPLGMLLVAGVLSFFVPEARGGRAIGLPVLTLPGIAGIALMIGMAVDANVLIFERIREELRGGKGLSVAVAAGFQRAFSAILDSNVTTILTAVILFIWGSGPIRGYAVTLAGGLLVSLYTAVVCVRMFMSAIVNRTQNTGVMKMMALLSSPNINFISKWKLATALSAIVIVGSWTWMISAGIKDPARALGIDFTGGSSVTMAFTTRIDVDEIRAVLDGAGVGESSIQYQKETEGAGESLLIKAGKNQGQAIEPALKAAYPDAGFRVLQQDDVGPQVGSELRGRAIKAMIFSLIGMIIYISWRFEFGFALGAVVALLHDALITAGLCFVLGHQINLTIIAALLTLVGYSVNDTIVIFDRIREDLRLVRGKSFLDICNLSLNQTLSRTILTSLLTLLSVAALLIFGGGAIKDFALAMFIGLIAGTYSTVYIATPVVLLWYRFKTPDLGKSVR